MSQPRSVYRNRILASLPESEIDRISRHLSPVTLKQYEPLMNGDVSHGYFLEEGVASVVVTVENGDTVEVGIVGIDGLVGLPILFGVPSTPGRTFVQIEGSGFRIDAKNLKEEFERDGVLRRQVQRYMQAFFVQTAQTAACNRLHTIEERLARWLMACRDRVESDKLHLTHDFLGQMLGAPRTTVTLAAGLLQRAGMIDYARGTVTITDRDQLENTACECYGLVRDAYRQLSLL
ncbi:MAG: Crp/Fnr family transcriptional regulator [Terracidiphilus sp.]